MITLKTAVEGLGKMERGGTKYDRGRSTEFMKKLGRRRTK